jgi:N-acetyl-alpha-D-muramate 1-phosphate uridylyltransferase
LLLVPRERAVGHAGKGDFLIDDAGKLSRGRGLVYTGAQILNPAFLAGMREEAFSLNLVWDGMLSRGGLFGMVYDGDWCDVGRPESIPLAEAMLEGAHVR